MTKYYLLITLALIVTSVVTSKKLECRSLQWAPGRRKAVFTAFINHIHCPTWTTRNTITKEPTKYSKLRLPEGQSFAFYCGTCFTPGSFKVNLTAQMYPDLPLILKPITPKKNQNKNEDLLHFKDGYTTCLISYGITKPIVRGGSLTCRSNIGIKTFEETITFSVQKANTEVVGEVENIEVPPNGVVRLQCSPKEESLLIPMRIWYNPDASEDKVPFAVPSLDQEIIYRPTKKEENISCSTYDLTNPTLVRITRYKLILKETTEDIKQGKWVVEEPEDTQSPKSSSNIILIVAIIIVVGVCLVALVLAFLGLCKRSRRRRDTEEETKDPNHLKLISSVSPYNVKRLQQQYRHQ